MIMGGGLSNIPRSLGENGQSCRFVRQVDRGKFRTTVATFVMLIVRDMRDWNFCGKFITLRIVRDGNLVTFWNCLMWEAGQLAAVVAAL